MPLGAMTLYNTVQFCPYATSARAPTHISGRQNDASPPFQSNYWDNFACAMHPPPKSRLLNPWAVTWWQRERYYRRWPKQQENKGCCDARTKRLRATSLKDWRKRPCIPELPGPGAAVQCHIFRYEKSKFSQRTLDSRYQH